ncbi:MAG: NINE protein [Rhodocyclaceae bacterium]
MSGNVYAAPKASLERLTKDCSECGEEINKKAVICPKCGVKQKGQVSKVALVLLTFFAGGLGAHKFYLKKPWWGLLYLLFFWTWIPGLVAFIEFIIYLCTSEESLNEKYEAGNSGVIIAIVVAIFGGIALIGILAAIALPQYQSYTMKVRATQAVQAVEPLRAEVQQFIVKNGRLPIPGDIVTDMPARNVPGIADIALQDAGVIEVQFNQQAMTGQTILFVPRIAGGQLSWDCSGGTLKPAWRPQVCHKP